MDYLSEFLFFSQHGILDKKYYNSRTAGVYQRYGFKLIFNKLCQDITSIFKWTYNPPAGEPKTIDETVIERGILYGGVAFTKSLPGALNGYPFCLIPSFLNNRTFYGYSSSVTLSDWSGNTYLSGTRNSEPAGTFLIYQDSDITNIANCVLIYDNAYRRSLMPDIIYYADRLSDINTKINGCIANIRGASYMWTSEERAESDREDMHRMELGLPIIYKYNVMDDMHRESAMLSTPGAVEELKALYESYDKTYSDFMNLHGVPGNFEVNKQSGVTPLEITENRALTTIRMNGRYNMRLKGIEQLEKIGITGVECTLENFQSNLPVTATEETEDNDGKPDKA